MPSTNRKIKQPITKGIAKVPVIMQLEALECGAACLTMILAYYDKWIPLEKVRQDCGVSRDGSNALNILKAARSYGLEANGYRFELESIQKEGLFPCIIHWNFNHFVVLNGFTRKKEAVLNDPARGTRTLGAYRCAAQEKLDSAHRYAPNVRPDAPISRTCTSYRCKTAHQAVH